MASLAGSVAAAWRLARYVVSHPLNRGREVPALVRLVRWQLGSRLVGAPVVIDWVNGAKLLVARGMTGATGNLYTGLHEYADMAFVLHFLRADDLLVDIGANVGTYTVLGAAVCRASVISIEPVPVTYERLIANVRLNRCESRVEALNQAVGAQSGELKFTSDLDTVNHAVAVGEQRENTITVPVTTLDQVLRSRRPTLIKIDVEGFEASVLAGAHDALQGADAMLVELNGSGERYGVSDRELAHRLEASGLGSYSYDPQARQLKPVDPLTVRGGNVLYIRDAEWVHERVREAPSFVVHGRAI